MLDRTISSVGSTTRDVVAPPSVHPETGERYQWRQGKTLDKRDLAPAPIEWIEAATADEGVNGRPHQTGDEDWTVDEGERHDAFVSIAGTPPRLDAMPPGCPFAPRCPMVFDRCLVERPPAYELIHGRRVACFLVEPGQEGQVAADA